MKYYDFIKAFNTPLLTTKGTSQRSDKNDLHKYVVLYDYIINAQYLKKQSPLFDKIVGIDIDPIEKDVVRFNFSDKVTLEQGMDGYDLEVAKYISNKHSKFDIILDDGDHMWESQIKFFELYYNLLAPGGVIMCEDIAEMYLPQLKQFCQQYEDFYVFDLRTKTNPHHNEIVAIIKNPI